MKSRTEAVIINSMNPGEADKLITFFSLERACSGPRPRTLFRQQAVKN